MSLFGPQPKGRRVIDRLRAMFPELEWRYEWPRWRNSAGWYVGCYAELTGDGDDSFVTTYRRSDTSERILL
jgi:hypothetical protein